MFAATHPDRTSGVIVQAPMVRGTPAPDYAGSWTREMNEEYFERVEQAWGTDAFVREWARLPMWESQRALPDEVRVALRAQRETNSAPGLANSLRGAGAVVDPPLHDRLGAIRAPTLLVAGALDAPYLAHAVEMQAHIPAARVVVVPEAGHAVHLERPDAFAGAVSAFLRPV